ncbi:MAG TPA: adenylate/guanylate cyclase domain-containing protein [Mycobacteriales bacterium]|nr:adenylate/guanylate cyclase domain-containing protein [Mycobacteriales bacterium]
MQIPPVNYLPTADGHIGWQSWGEGEPVILDTVPSFMAGIEDVPDQPRFLRWVTGLAGIGRLLRYDPPGVGTSDAGSVPPTFADWADAGVKVLDAAGVEKAAVIGSGGTAFAAFRMWERHPDRVSALLLVNGAARIAKGEDYPDGVDLSVGDVLVSNATSPETAANDDLDLMLMAPTAATDPDFRSWWGRVARRNARPRIAGPINAEIWALDLRYLLPTITVPTLVVVRSNIASGPAIGKAVADAVPGARYVEVPGQDLVPFIGDFDPILAEIRALLTGERHANNADRVFAAVMFTDLVGSTEEVVRRGDGPWRALLADHVAMVKHEVERFGGRLVKDLGDGTLCTFPVPGVALRCALSLVERSEGQLGVPMRAGVHGGEIELQGEDVAGINVHIAARVSALANAGEVLVSTTLVDLVAGSPFAFEDRGMHELKGVPGSRQVWAAKEA